MSCQDLRSAALNLGPTSLLEVCTFQMLRNTPTMFIVCMFRCFTLSCWVTLLCSPQESCLCFLIPIHLGNFFTIIFCSGNPPFEWGLRERPAQKYLAKWISTRILSQACHDVIKQNKMGLCQKGIFVSEELNLELIYKSAPPPLWVWAKFTEPGCERRAMATLRQYPSSCFQHRGVRDQDKRGLSLCPCFFTEDEELCDK